MNLKERECLFNLGFYNLDRNENLDVEYLSKLGEIFKKYSRCVSTYPDYPGFLDRASSFLGLSPSELLVTCGCSEAIKISIEAFVGNEDDVLVLDPTYQWAISHLESTGAKIHSLPHDTPIEKIVSYVNKNNIKFIYLCNPNNPTGTVFDFDSMRKLALCKSLVFVDESYIEFGGTSIVSLIPNSENLIVGRSFSKAWGLAGLRLGFLVSNGKMIELLEPLKLKASANSIAIKVASELMNNYNLISDSVNRIQEGSSYIRHRLLEMGFRVFNEPNVNFIVSDIEEEKLMKLKILSKPMWGGRCFTTLPKKQADQIFRFQ